MIVETNIEYSISQYRVDKIKNSTDQQYLNTELIDAWWKGNTKLVQYILKDSRIVEIYDRSKYVIHAARFGNIDMIKAIVTHSDTDLSYNKNEALREAIYNSQLDTVKFLIADYNVLSKIENTFLASSSKLPMLRNAIREVHKLTHEELTEFLNFTTCYKNAK